MKEFRITDEHYGGIDHVVVTKDVAHIGGMNCNIFEETLINDKRDYISFPNFSSKTISEMVDSHVLNDFETAYF